MCAQVNSEQKKKNEENECSDKSGEEKNYEKKINEDRSYTLKLHHLRTILLWSRTPLGLFNLEIISPQNYNIRFNLRISRKTKTQHYTKKNGKKKKKLYISQKEKNN